jgi:replicative DNA helicase
MGKTAAIMAIALNAARRGKKVYFWSGEMPRKQLRERFMAVETAINSKKLRRGLRANGMDSNDWAKFVAGSGKLGKLPIWMDTLGSISPTILQSRVERLARRVGGLDLIIVDYIGLMRPYRTSANRNNELGSISNYLKQHTARMAPVLAAAQLSRKCEERTDKRPVLSDLRDSGELEQDADTVTFMYRDAVYNEATEFPNRAELILSKNRHGDVGTAYLHFEKSLTKLTNAVRQYVDLKEY